MTEPASGAVTATAGIAAVLTLVPFGVSLGTLMLGGGCFLLGVCARAGAGLFKKLDGTQHVTIYDFLRPVAASLCMIPVAAAASCIVFFAAHLSNVKADTSCGGVLLIAGLRGLEGFTWLSNIAADVFTRFAPGQRPGGTP